MSDLIRNKYTVNMGEPVEYGDLEEFMEVVTTYRCKFCDFKARSVKEVAQHVKDDHNLAMERKATATPLSDVVQNSQQTVNILKAAAQNLALSDNLSGTGTSATVLTSFISGSENIPSFSSVNAQVATSKHPEGTYSIISNSNTPRLSSSSFPGNLVISMSNGQTLLKNNTPNAAVKIVNQVQEIENTGQQLTGFPYVAEASGGQYIIENGTVHVLVQDNSVQLAAMENESRECGEEQGVSVGTDTSENLIHVVTDTQHSQEISRDTTADRQTAYPELQLPEPIPEESEIITKDVYLCGNCSEGFASIQECKDHMTNVHEVTDFQTGTRVDTGTQMEPRKRPGRRKKSEKMQQDIKEEPEEDIVLSESDEEWSEQLMTCPTRSRRKRKPPAALRTDYYLGRTKRKEQTMPREPRPVLGIRCSFPGCAIRFKEEEMMKEHASYHIEGEAAYHFKCSKCEMIFDNWKQTRHHLWKSHRVGIDLLSCRLCDNFKTDIPSKLKIHMEVHGEAKPYKCNTCGKAFKQFSQLKNHETLHLPGDVLLSSEASDKWYSPKQCDICGRSFVNVKCMKKHKEDVHGTIKPYQCTYCTYAASRKAMLVLHLRKHSGEKPFKCDSCNYCCGDHNSLRRHKMRHTGYKPYRCPHCPYASIQAISLKVHVKNKHPGMSGVFNCPMCMYGTVNKTQYDNHLMDHKNGLIKSVVPNEQVVIMPKASKYKSNKTMPATTKPGGIIIGSAVPTVYTSVTGNQMFQVISNPDTVARNGSIQTVIDAANMQSPVLFIDGRPVKFRLQTNENGENVLVEEVESVNNSDNTGNTDEAAAQLIYTALNAISETEETGSDNIDPQNLVAGVQSGEIQTSIETHSKEGVTTHTITFHLPEGEQLTREVTLVGENDIMEETGADAEVDNSVTEWQENV